MKSLTIASLTLAAAVALTAGEAAPKRVIAAHVAVVSPQRPGVAVRFEKPKGKAKRRSRLFAAARWVGAGALFGGEPPQ